MHVLVNQLSPKIVTGLNYLRYFQNICHMGIKSCGLLLLHVLSDVYHE